MRIYVVLLVASLILASCTVTEKLEFVEVKSLKIMDTSLENFILQNVLFKNKNSVGGELQARDIHVLIDSMAVATIQSEHFKVPIKDEFEIPLKATIPFKKVFTDNKQSLLSNAINMISKKKIVVKFRGDIRYQLGLFHYDYPLEYEQEISLEQY